MSSILVTLVRAAGTVLQAGTLLLLARFLPPAELGWYATGWTVLSINRVLGPLGLDQIALSGRIGNDGGADQATLADALGVVTAAAVLVGIVLGLASLPLVPAAGLAAIGVIGLSMPAFAVCGVLTSYVRARGRNLAAQAPESLLLPLFILVGLFLALTLGTLTLLAALVVVLASIWLTVVVYLALAWASTEAPTLSFRFARLRPYARECGHILSAMTVTAFAARSPIFLANLLLGPAAAAVVEVGNRFGTLASIITTSTTSTYSPYLAQAHKQRDDARARRLIKTGGLLAGAGAFTVLAMLVVAFPFLTGPVLPVYYEASYPLMIVIGVATAINAGFGLASSYLFMSTQAGSVLKYSTAQLVCLAICSYLLSVAFGVFGIGIAVLLGAVVRDGGLMLRVAKVLGK